MALQAGRITTNVAALEGRVVDNVAAPPDDAIENEGPALRDWIDFKYFRSMSQRPLYRRSLAAALSHGIRSALTQSQIQGLALDDPKPLPLSRL